MLQILKLIFLAFFFSDKKKDPKKRVENKRRTKRVVSILIKYPLRSFLFRCSVLENLAKRRFGVVKNTLYTFQNQSADALTIALNKT